MPATNVINKLFVNHVRRLLNIILYEANRSKITIRWSCFLIGLFFELPICTSDFSF
jgi:hypothetical protein